MYGLISVIMPAYNVEKYIGATIESVLNQTYQNWELIIINDGSTDDTADVAKKMAEKEPRIKLYSQENGGVSRARNKGLTLAQGDYIAFLDADDLWKPEFLEKLINAKDGARLVYCGYERLHTNGKCEQTKNNFANGWMLPQYLQGSSYFCMGTFIVDKKLLNDNNINFPDGCLFGQDVEFVMKILAIVQTNSVPEYLAIYRCRPGSATQSKWTIEKRIQSVHARIRGLEYIREHCVRINEIDELLRQLHATIIIKFLWFALKYGYYRDAMTLINTTFANDLGRINQTKLKFKYVFRYRIIMSKNILLWKTFSFLDNLL
jgi:glycosyltransferase involved in cell wall biosynthesis